MLFIKDENVNRLSWRAGCTRNIIPSRENNVRAMLNVLNQRVKCLNQPNTNRLCTVLRYTEIFFLLEMQNEIQEIEQPVKEIKKRTSKPRKSMKSNNIKYQGFMRDLS